MEFLGNLLLLIVGGNDTIRNTMTGSILAMHQNPEQLRKLQATPRLIPSMVSETIRWQSKRSFSTPGLRLDVRSWPERPSSSRG